MSIDGQKYFYELLNVSAAAAEFMDCQVNTRWCLSLDIFAVLESGTQYRMRVPGPGNYQP